MKSFELTNKRNQEKIPENKNKISFMLFHNELPYQSIPPKIMGIKNTNIAFTQI